MSNETRTYRGGSLEELLPRIKAELGDDAVVVRQREGLAGGVGGFFQRRCVEVEVCRGSAADALVAPAAPTFEITDGPAAGPEDFATALASAQPLTVEDVLAAAPSPTVAAPASAYAALTQSAVAVMEPVTAEGQSPESHVGRDARLVEPTPEPEIAVAEPQVTLEGPTAESQPEADEVVVTSPQVDALPVPRDTAAPLAPRPAAADELVETLMRRGLAAPLVGEVVDEVVTHRLPFAAPAELRSLVAGELARRIAVAPIAGHADHVVAFAGPGGAGKTRVVAALAAAYAARGGVAVAVVTLRPKDGGAQLATLLAPFAVQVHAVDTPKAAADRVAALRPHALVLVDTPGVSPRDTQSVRALANQLGKLGADEVHLTVPATMAAEAMGELLDGTRTTGVSKLVLTHGDETERIGSVVQLGIDAGLPISYVGDAPDATAGLRPADPEDLAKALVA